MTRTRTLRSNKQKTNAPAESANATTSTKSPAAVISEFNSTLGGALGPVNIDKPAASVPPKMTRSRMRQRWQQMQERKNTPAAQQATISITGSLCGIAKTPSPAKLGIQMHQTYGTTGAKQTSHKVARNHYCQLKFYVYDHFYSYFSKLSQQPARLRSR